MPPVSSPSRARRLELGRVAALLDGADLRYVAVDGIELVRRVHVTVRDEAWGTLEADAVRTEVRESPDAIEVRAEASHASAAAELSWTVVARLDASGALSYEADLAPGAPFTYARMGLCLLLPPAGVVGRRYVAQTPAGDVEDVFAAEIAPQRIDAGEPAPLFPAFSALRIDGEAGRLDVRFEGDLFELEDQRNWSDGSFKVYCTPLSRPRPQHAEPGRVVRQRIAVEPPAGAVTRPAAPAPAAIEVAIEVALAPAGARVPGIGLTLAPGGEPDPAATGERLRGLGLEHVRVELREPAHAAERLAQAAALASAAGAALAVAVYLRDAAEATALADALCPHAQRIARLLVFSREQPVSPAPLVAAARAQLADVLPAARVVGGTDGWFVELNRTRSDAQAADGVAWSITPQVHGFDALTIVEALEPQAAQVATARAFAPGRDLVVGPVTLRPRGNPEAADAREQAIDPRQGDLFAAAWTAASVSQLAAAGATAATYYETSGPRGALPVDAPGVLPCWHPLADAGAWRGWDVLPTRSSDPLAAQALAVRGPDGALGLLVANLRDEPTIVRLDGLPTARARVRTLDARTRVVACADPAAFRAQATEHPLEPGGVLRLVLEPHAVATVEGSD